MCMVLRNAESFFVIFNRLMDISGSHTNIADLFDNITRKYHKLIQQLPRWSWKYSCGTGSTLGQKPNKKYFHPYKNQIHLKAKQSWRVCWVRYVSRHTAGIYRRYDRYQTLRVVGKFDTTSRPLPDTSVSSVRHRYRYPAATGTDVHTGIGHFGKFGTTSIPVRDISASWVPHSIPLSDTSVSSIRQ